jgi:hypothetical protein
MIKRLGVVGVYGVLVVAVFTGYAAALSPLVTGV